MVTTPLRQIARGTRAFVVGAKGHHLSAAEIAFYRQAQPFGLIVFGVITPPPVS